MAEEIICPTCNSPNDAFAQECAVCGAALDASLDAAAETDFEIEEVIDVAAEEDFSAGYGFAVEETEVSATDDGLYELEVEPVVDEEDGLYELEVEANDADFGSPEDDILAADGGMALEASSQVERFGDGEEDSDEFGYELTEERDLTMGAELTEPANIEVETAPEEAGLPPELAAILNPERVEREPIIELPIPGNYRGPASLRVFSNGEQRAELAVDTACTVLGRPAASDDAEAFELEPSAGAEFPFDDEFEDEPAFDLHELSEVSEPSDTLNLQNHAAEEEFNDVAVESSEPAVAPVEDYEDPGPLKEGPIINLSQYGDAAKFALRHGYIFRQNKNYTLCVLSDMGTQLNDEMLELGSRRPLVHGDMIILGGEVALQFRAPAS